MKFQPNLAKSDRILRMIAGIAFLLLGFISDISEFWKIFAFVAGGVLIATGISAYCPVYELLGFDGYHKKTNPRR